MHLVGRFRRNKIEANVLQLNLYTHIRGELLDARVNQTQWCCLCNVLEVNIVKHHEQSDYTMNPCVPVNNQGLRGFAQFSELGLVALMPQL